MYHKYITSSIIDSRYIKCNKGITLQHTKQNLLNNIMLAKHSIQDRKSDIPFEYNNKEFNKVVNKIHNGGNIMLYITRILMRYNKEY